MHFTTADIQRLAREMAKANGFDDPDMMVFHGRPQEYAVVGRLCYLPAGPLFPIWRAFEPPVRQCLAGAGRLFGITVEAE
jgi:hypothetical protein